MQGGTGRLLALEGLRGVAAVVVTFYHAFLIFWCMMIFGQNETNPIVQHLPVEDNLFGTPFFAFYSGIFAVAIFFVLSGFVLSVNFFSTGKIEIVRKLAAKRYIRLMLPALASVMLAWLLLSLGLSANSQAFEITQSPWLFGQWNFTPDFFEALTQGVWGAFTGSSVSYNSVLWTMVYELVGSLLVFFVVAIFGKYKRRWIIYILLIFLTLQTWYLGFIIGMILADLYANKRAVFTGSSSVVFSVFLLIVGIFLGGYPLTSPNSGSLYSTMTVPGFDNVSIYTTIGASMVVVAVLTIPRLKMVLSGKVMSGLGRYTYSLYLVHKLVLFTVCTAAFVWFNSFMEYNLAALSAIIISLPVIAIVTYLFEKYVDTPSIRVSGRFANWLLQSEKPSSK